MIFRIDTTHNPKKQRKEAMAKISYNIILKC